MTVDEFPVLKVKMAESADPIIPVEVYLDNKRLNTIGGLTIKQRGQGATIWLQLDVSRIEMSDEAWEVLKRSTDYSLTQDASGEPIEKFGKRALRKVSS